ncbi:MAG: hypothetical protein ACYC5K_08325 [Saccharofermentanales bacterium]
MMGRGGSVDSTRSTKDGSEAKNRSSKHSAGKRSVRFAIRAAILVAVVTVAVLGWGRLSAELARQKPVEGFDVFLKNKDICALAFRDGEVKDLKCPTRGISGW